jgi:hypothetical protein
MACVLPLMVLSPERTHRLRSGTAPRPGPTIWVPPVCPRAPFWSCNIDQPFEYFNIYISIYLLIVLSWVELDDMTREGGPAQTRGRVSAHARGRGTAAPPSEPTETYETRLVASITADDRSEPSAAPCRQGRQPGLESSSPLAHDISASDAGRMARWSLLLPPSSFVIWIISLTCLDTVTATVSVGLYRVSAMASAMACCRRLR